MILYNIITYFPLILIYLTKKIHYVAILNFEFESRLGFFVFV